MAFPMKNIILSTVLTSGEQQISQVPTYFASSRPLMKLETSCSLLQPMKIAGGKYITVKKQKKNSTSHKQMYLGKGFL